MSSPQASIAVSEPESEDDPVLELPSISTLSRVARQSERLNWEHHSPSVPSFSSLASQAATAIANVEWKQYADASLSAANRALRATRALAITYAPEPIAKVAEFTDLEAMPPFEERFPYEDRLRMRADIARTYPDKIPVIIERQPGSMLPQLEQYRLLFSKTVRVHSIRSVIVRKLGKEYYDTGIFLVDQFRRPISVMNETVESLTQRQNRRDGFLYILYREENVFG